MLDERDTQVYSREPVAQTLRVLWYNRKRIRAFVLAGLGAGLLLTVGQFGSPDYRAETTVTMLPSYSEILYTSSRPDFVGQNPALVLTQTQTEFLLSRNIARRLVVELIKSGDIDTVSHQDVAPIQSAIVGPVSRFGSKGLQILNYGRVANPTVIDALTDKMRDGITVRNVPGSFILNIAATWTSPDVARKAADMLAHIYVENTREQNNQTLMLTREFIEERIGEENDRLRQVEALIRDVKSGSPVYLSLSSETPLQLRQMEEYASERSRLEMRLLQLRAQIESCRLVGSFRDTVPISAELTATQNALLKLRALMSNRQKELNRIPDLEYDLIQLEQRKQEIRETLSALQQSRIQAGIAEASFVSTVRVIDPAVTPAFPLGGGLLANLVAAVLAGLFLSFGSIVVTECFSRKIRSFADIGDRDYRPIATCPSAAPDGGRRFLWAGSGVTDHTTLARHAQYIAEELCAGTQGQTVLLDSIRGPSRHLDALERILKAAPRGVLVVNLDEQLHRKFVASAGDSVRMQTSDEAEYDMFSLYGGSITCLRPRQSAGGTLSRAEISRLQCILKEVKGQYQTVLTVAPGQRSSPLSPALSKLADRRVLLVESDTDTQDDLRSYENRQSNSAAAGTECIITGVQYTPDFMFA
ncbi:MAG: hypothetical protein GF331_21305 [Chitinivibrionales bacterium]|nr:hypothetical protein [Chitinivibrionales bacterium]